MPSFENGNTEFNQYHIAYTNSGPFTFRDHDNKKDLICESGATFVSGSKTGKPQSFDGTGITGFSNSVIFQPIGINDFDIITSEDITLGNIAAPSVALVDAYPNWFEKSFSIPATDTDDDIICLPLSLGNTYADTITKTQATVWEGVSEYEETKTDTETGSGTIVDTWTPPSDPGAFALDLTSFFPFCIPFDLYDFLTCLNADPVAPVINWELSLPGIGTYPITIDLSPFDSVAQLLRRLQLLLFIIGLAVKTRDLIKG